MLNVSAIVATGSENKLSNKNLTKKLLVHFNHVHVSLKNLCFHQKMLDEFTLLATLLLYTPLFHSECLLYACTDIVCVRPDLKQVAAP